MRAATLKQVEQSPETYPDLGSPSLLSEQAQELDLAPIWQRIESYVAHRWTPRNVEWTVEGPGDWSPPLVPAAIESVETWSGDQWQITTDYRPSPCGGLILPSVGPYRIVATVGANNEPPATVIEAVRRLAEWIAAEIPNPGRVPVSYARIGRSGVTSWLAHAIDGSGAGDLLRPYRRAH